MRKSAVFVAAGAIFGLGSLALPDRPEAPDRGIVVVPGGAITPPGTAVVGGASVNQWAPAATAPDVAETMEGPIWDDGDAPGTWSPPDLVRLDD